MPSQRQRTKFVVDAMLGSLARKLRVFGFDATYYRDGSDARMMQLARAEGRVILTADRSLASRAASSGLPALLVTGRTDGRRLASAVRSAKALKLTLVRGEPLCSLCGGELGAISKAEASSAVPPSVAKRHRLFYRCRECGKLYWRGSHWKKLRSLERAFAHKA